MKGFRLPACFFVVLLLGLKGAFAQSPSPMPFTIENNSEFSDDELYVAIVGEDLSGPPGAYVWVDMKTGQQMPMDASYNTVQGPMYGGNKGPGQEGKYANCFTKLSEIPNKTVSLAGIQGCRMFISVKEPLYLYFFGSTGSVKGYSSPNHTDPTDPNTGILYELIELTYNNSGFWGNTSRVDSYHYPIALELFGENDFHQKTGELLSHEQIGDLYKASVPVEFQGCYDEESGKIVQPTKTEAFADGTIGTMPDVGPYVNYMKPYIDAVWEKYKNEDLIFYSGEAGVWKGRVINERLEMVCQTGGFTGRKGIVVRRPTTQEAFEGKGVLDNRVEDGTVDLVVQAQLCAALTRHMVDVTTPNPGEQDWSDESKYYQESPCNHYAKFWHQQGVRYDGKAYGFAYDDVFDQSSTTHTPNPTSVKVILGGYYKEEIVAVQEPFNGVRAMIPGIIEAENYDEGGEGLAFHETTLANEGGADYRDDAVDIEVNGAGYNLGYLSAGEWLDYSVIVEETADYTLAIEFAAADENGGGSFRILLDDQELVPETATGSTGGWTVWQELVLENIALTEGEHTLTFEVVKGDFNLDKMSFEKDIPVVLSIFSSENSGASIFPNPVSEQLFLSPSIVKKGSVSVLDGTGRLVLRKEVNDGALDVSSLRNGTYVLRVEADGELMVFPFVKQ